jgi:hypothetical protein
MPLPQDLWQPRVDRVVLGLHCGTPGGLGIPIAFPLRLSLAQQRQHVALDMRVELRRPICLSEINSTRRRG